MTLLYQKGLGSARGLMFLISMARREPRPPMGEAPRERRAGRPANAVFKMSKNLPRVCLYREAAPLMETGERDEETG